MPDPDVFIVELTVEIDHPSTPEEAHQIVFDLVKNSMPKEARLRAIGSHRIFQQKSASTF